MDRLPTCYRSRAKLKLVGSVGKYVIYDLNYYFDQDYEPPDTVGAKSILVRSAPGVFHEIYHRAATQIDASFPATVIINVGTIRLLEATYNVGGMYMDRVMTYFSVSKDGPRLMHVDALSKAAEKAVPDDSTTWHPTASFDFKTMTWSVGTDPTGRKVDCCNGRVVVQFRIEDGDFVPVRASFVRN